MEYEVLVCIIWVLSSILAFVIGLFVKSYLPKYMEKKGENRADIEDKELLTTIEESVKTQMQKELADYGEVLRFKNSFAFSQYSELYVKLYITIVQSEYVRYMLNTYNQGDFTFEDEPFIQIEPTLRTNTSWSAQGTKRTSEKIETEFSALNKKGMADLIINNCHLASQELLRMAVAFRFAHDNNSAGVSDKGMADGFMVEENILIVKMVRLVVVEYNRLCKVLNLDYDKKELETGIPSDIFFKSTTD